MHVITDLSWHLLLHNKQGKQVWSKSEFFLEYLSLECCTHFNPFAFCNGRPIDIHLLTSFWAPQDFYILVQPVTSQLGQQEDTLKSSIDFGNSKDAPEEIQAPHLQLEKEAQAKLPSADLPEQADMWESDITSQVNPKAANVSLEHDVEGYSEDKSVPTENNSDPHQELDDKITHESEPSRDKPEQVKSIANSEWTSRAAPDVQVKDGSRDSMEPLIADDGGADSDESDIKDDVNMPEIAHTLPKQVLEQETSDWPISKSIDTISEGNEQRLKSGR